MSKWALWCAHRYLGRDSNARMYGANGRPLQAPWRVRSEAAKEIAARLRAARPQPRWPHLLGWLLLGTAACAVVHPDYAMPSPLPLASARAPAEIKPFVLLGPSGPSEGVPRQFEFRAAGVPPPYRLVFCDEDYTEVAVAQAVEASCFRPGPELAAKLGTQGTLHWFVEGERVGRDGLAQRVRSAFETCQIR